VIVGPSFSDSVSLVNELSTHRVSAWTVDDLLTAIGNDVDAYECRELFAPGFVHDALGDLVWSRAHGNEKRIAIMCDMLRRLGYDEQRGLVGRMPADDMPVLTLDAATILVATALQQAGTAAAPSRAELQQAMNDLVRAGEAATIAGREGIIIRRGNAPVRE
jgi:hypothetical protein